MNKSEHFKLLLKDAQCQFEKLILQRSILNNHIDDLENTIMELQIDLCTAEIEEAGLIVNSSSKDDCSLSSVHKTIFNFYEV